MTRGIREKIALRAATLLGCVLSSCTVGPDFVRPDPPEVEQYTSGTRIIRTEAPEGKAQRFDAGAQVPEKWWALFNSPKLDPIVTDALGRSPTLHAALARLRQSQQLLRAGEGAFYPQINAALGVSGQKSNPPSFGVNAPSTTFSLFTLSSSFSYALDLFGGQRRTVEGFRAQVDSSRFAALAAYLTLTGNIVNTVIARATYQAQIEATKQVLQAERDAIALVQANVTSGTAPYSSLLAVQTQLSATEAALPPLAQRLNQADHLLAVLSGQMPARWSAPFITLADLTLPANLPESLPSDLVRQRPDILQSEAELHAACAQVGVATAALLPSLTLSGTIGLNNTSANELLSGKSSFWNIGAELLAPLFRGGTLLAQKQAAVEAFQAATATYRQTVLSGVQQVADALRALEHDAEGLQAQSSALRSADEGLKLALASYHAGTTGYLQLLTAETQYFQARLSYLQWLGQRYQDTVALFVALGGGWWNASQEKLRNVARTAPSEKSSP